jgi:DNA-binding transcriptional MerR regulator
MASDKSRRTKAVAAIVGNVRRASKPVRRHSRDVIDTAVAQLFDAMAAPSVDDAGNGEYRMEELARLAGTTTRNIRLYRDRGLLDAPDRIGRLAIYNDSHLARLRLISDLLRRGYTIANARELLTAHRDGKNLGDILGVSAPSATTTSWAPDHPRSMTVSQAQDLIADPPAFERLTALGIIQIEGAKATVTRPSLIATFNEIRTHGITLDTLLDIHEQVLPHIESISDVLVRAGVAYAADVLTPDHLPSDDSEFAELLTALIAFAPLAVSSINGTLSSSMQGVAQKIVGGMLAEFVQRSPLHTGDPHLPAGSDPPAPPA